LAALADFDGSVRRQARDDAIAAAREFVQVGQIFFVGDFSQRFRRINLLRDARMIAGENRGENWDGGAVAEIAEGTDHLVPGVDITLAPHSHSAPLRGLACVSCSAGVALEDFEQRREIAFVDERGNVWTEERHGTSIAKSRSKSTFDALADVGYN